MTQKNEEYWTFDVRVRERNLNAGILTEGDLEKYYASLPDLADQVQPFGILQPALAQPEPAMHADTAHAAIAYADMAHADPTGNDASDAESEKHTPKSASSQEHALASVDDEAASPAEGTSEPTT